MNLKNIKFTFLFLFFFIINISGVSADTTYSFDENTITLCTYSSENYSCRTSQGTSICYYKNIVVKFSGGGLSFYNEDSTNDAPNAFMSVYSVDNKYGDIPSNSASLTEMCPTNIYADADSSCSGMSVCYGSSVDDCTISGEGCLGVDKTHENTATLYENVLQKALTLFKNSYSEYSFSTPTEAESKCDSLINSSLIQSDSNSLSDALDAQLLVSLNAVYGTEMTSLPSYLSAFTADSKEYVLSQVSSFLTNCVDSDVYTEEEIAIVEQTLTTFDSYSPTTNTEFNTDVSGCDLISPLTDELNGIFEFIRVGLIGLLIALTLLDFFKALTSEKEDELKKAYTKLIKRVIIVAILFILPALINFILGIFIPDLNTCIDNI
ncbi:MAG: hypothetical protein R3Y21_02025 [Mycoplasmatota bacterium]